MSTTRKSIGGVDSRKRGLYQLTYTATDAAGNIGSVSRVVTVVAATSAATTGTDSTATVTTTP